MGIIKLKRGNNDNFQNVVLEVGEPAFVIDTGKLYVGDGTNNILINPDIAASLPDVGTAGTFTKVTTDSKGRVISGSSLTASDIPTLSLSKISGLGTAASRNVGTSSGNVPVLNSDGKLDTSILPALAITETFVVSSQAAMLGLAAQIGDVAVRTDLSKTFILTQEPASTLSNWQELLTPEDSVLSVNGKTGVVTLNKSDIGLGNVDNESKATMFDSPVFTGQPTAPTPSSETNNTQIATTAFVKSQGYLTSLPTHNHDELYEPKFTKGSAFNKNFGTTAGTVAEGNHTHSQYLTSSSTIDGGVF